MEIKLLFLMCLIYFATTSAANTKKKSTEESVTTDVPGPGPAILAIEIVDGNDNSTDVRNNTKRTIESALGYGYQGNYYPTSAGKKYMVYPYSQQDIPPSKPSTDSSENYQSNLNIQKSVSYNLGTKTEVDQTSKELFSPVATQTPAYNHGQQYYPSTLFSTVGQSGIIGGLSSNFPNQHQHKTPTATIPVIILRVYTNQLESPAIYPNLPQSHPYANNLNSINIQSILSNYIQQYMQQAIQSINKPVYPTNYPSSQQSAYPNTNLVYQGYQEDKDNYAYYHQPQVAYQQPASSAEYKEEATLPTSENYPADSHTRVIYHGPKGHLPNSYGYSTAGSVSQEYGAPKNSYTTNQMSQISQISQIRQEYGTPKQSYSTNQISQEYGTPKQTYSTNQISQISQEYSPQAKPNYQTKVSQQVTQNYETPKQTYSAPDDYLNSKQTYNSNEVFTDSNGQSYIYVYPSQMQQHQTQQYYQQEYSQPTYSAQSYTSSQPTYSSQEYSSQSQEYQQEDRKYLPTAAPELPTKLYNYHADSAKDRSKKSSGNPVTFESKKEKSSSNKN